MFKYPLNRVYIIIPFLLLGIMVLGWKRKKNILQELGLKIKSEKLRIFIMFLGLFLIGIALLGPQKLEGTMEIKKESLDIYVLLDTSKSMLTEDIKPNRLEREKQIVSKILESLEGERVGFIPFSSSAYIQMPLTDDYDMAKMFLDVVDTDMIGGGGSDVSKAILLANDSFERTSKGDKVILIISDGEEHDTYSEKALRNLMDSKLKVYAIGVGTKKGGLIPVYNKNGHRVAYKKDDKGNHVVSKLNDKTLKGLAAIGNGKYYESTLNGEEIKLFLADISYLKKELKKSKEVNQYEEIFMYFLGLGLALFLAAYLLPVRRRKL